MKILSWSIFMVFVGYIPGYAQINFGQFYDSNTLSTQVLQNLSYGTIIVGDTKDVDLGSNDEGVIEISGLPFLDVMVTVPPIDFLYLDGDDSCLSASCRIAVTINFHYTNRGETDFQPGYESSARPFSIGGMARFQIRERVSGPPGPPPTPTITGVSLPAAQQAYIYVSGSITNSTGAGIGSYSNTVIVTISYN
jgi:hypothetical protein